MCVASTQEQRRGDSFINPSEAILVRDLLLWLRRAYFRRNQHVSDIRDILNDNRDNQEWLEQSRDWSSLSVGVICLYKAQAWYLNNVLADAGLITSSAHRATGNAPAHNHNDSSRHSRETGGDNTSAREDPATGGPTCEPESTSSSTSSLEIRVSTVDAFQGSEMDIIIICTSRMQCSSFIR